MEIESTPPPPADSGALLLEVALQFGTTLDLDSLLPLVLQRVTDMLQADRALFALLDRRGEVQRAVLHNLEWDGPGHPLPVSKGLITEVMQEQRPVVVADARSSSTFQRNQSVRLFQLRFMMGVPVSVCGECRGVLYVDSRASQVKDLEAETSTLVALARLVGTAVENARLFEEQRYRMRLLAQLVHDLRAPISVVLANAELLQAMVESPEETMEMAEDIAASAQRMRRMVDNTLRLSRIEAGADHSFATYIDLREAVRKHVRGLDIIARPLGLSFEIDLPETLPRAHTIPDRLWLILDNLLFNALRHAPRGSAITIAAGVRPDAGPLEARRRVDDEVDIFSRSPGLRAVPAHPFVVLSVHNGGAPIPDAVLPRLFDAFVRAADEEEGTMRSNGLGLSIVQQCVRNLGGCVWAESSTDAGTTFSFSLPTDATEPPVEPPPETRNDTMPMRVVPGGRD